MEKMREGVWEKLLAIILSSDADEMGNDTIDRIREEDPYFAAFLAYVEVKLGTEVSAGAVLAYELLRLAEAEKEQ